MNTVNGDFHPLWVFQVQQSVNKIRCFSYVPFGDGLPGFPACPHHSRDWVRGMGHISKASPIEDIVFALNHEE